MAPQIAVSVSVSSLQWSVSGLFMAINEVEGEMIKV